MSLPGLLPVFLGLTTLGAPPAVSGLPEIWYREVFEGNIPGAAKEYEALYLAQPSTSLTPRLQQRAAFRAGQCFERLGLHSSATPAYLAAARAVGASPAIASQALVRLRALRADTFTSDATEEIYVDVAVQGLQDQLSGQERLRLNGISNLEGFLISRRKDAALRQELLQGLSRRGVSIAFGRPAGIEAALGESLASSLKEAGLPDQEIQLLWGALRDRAAVDCLLSLRAGDLARALPAQRRLAALQSVGLAPPAAEGTARVFQELSAAGASGSSEDRRIAALRSIELDLLRKSALTADLRARLEEAAQAEQRSRRDQALVPLDRIRAALDWADPALAADAEIADLATSARLKVAVLLKNAEALSKAAQTWSLLRARAAQLLGVAQALLEEIALELDERGSATLLGRPDGRDVCRAELESLLGVVARSLAGAASTGGELGASAEGALAQATLLAEWVPPAVTPALRTTLGDLSTAALQASKRKPPAPVRKEGSRPAR